MHRFQYVKGHLWVEEVPIQKIAQQHGTPLYIYSANTIRDNYNRLAYALSVLPYQICYAMKANSNLSIVRELVRLGSGFDVTSAGELYRVIEAGGDPGRCTFVGVGKSTEEIEYGLREGIYSFIVESEAELEHIERIARRLRKSAPFALRVNPNVDAHTHKKITTGLYENKFGIPYEAIEPIYRRAARSRYLKARGVQIHIGSQITDVTPFEKAVTKMLPLVHSLKDRYGIEFFDIGGGMGIVYHDALASGKPEWWKARPEMFTPELYASRLIKHLLPLNIKILLEPGRYIVGNSGIIVTQVLYIKKNISKTFAIVDAAMTELIRPTLYEAYHEIVPLRKASASATKILYDVVGPVCESGDYLAKARALPKLKVGDYLAILSTGAYGFVMASNYNARPRPAELLVDGKQVKVARRRETLKDLIRGEI
ncbi:MAG: diaminopimelate decarboxylase [Methylacidiphilales bacterium]|nr:diaminopimelate decarboxylase [Candidatus Methylacidiphilales bacterium]MDW8348929.1 diaminopimelate decarboxylase [Verrucomicrobiae bacterium]